MVALGCELGSEGGGLFGFGFAVFEVVDVLPGEGIQVGLKLGKGVLDDCSAAGVDELGGAFEKGLLVVGFDCPSK